MVHSHVTSSDSPRKPLSRVIARKKVSWVISSACSRFPVRVIANEKTRI